MATNILYNIHPDFPTEGIRFIDLTPSLFDSVVTAEIIKGLIGDFPRPDFIISPDARGFIWGGMVAQKLGVGFIPVRKSGKLPKGAVVSSVNYQTEYSTTSLCLPRCDIKGKTLLFVDDVYATGGTYNAVKKLVAKHGGALIGISVIVDIELDKTQKVKSLAKASEL
jgi:adenine phosphoribosyltransferase